MDDIKLKDSVLKQSLSSSEVEKLKKEGKVNKVVKKTDNTYKKTILHNIFSFFNILLIVLGIILIYFKKYNSVFFLVILVANTLLGLAQEIRSKRLVDKLNLLNESKIKTIRDNKIVELYSSQLVLGDVILLENGMQIPCDSIILDGIIRVDESLLTGESVHLKKVKNDNIFSGSYVTNGSCFAKVLKVGKDNYVEILQAKSKKFKSSKSLIYKQLNYLFKAITFIVIIFAFLDFFVFISANIETINWDSYESIYSNIQKGIIGPLAGSLISMIPSGMYLLTSTTLVVAVLILLKKNVVVQNMYSIETLARVDTLCLDKTGTITDGSMVVVDYKIKKEEGNHIDFKNYMANFNYYLKDNNFTSVALNNYFKEENNLKVNWTLPFSSANKYSAIQFDDGFTLVVGAFGFVPLKNNEECKNEVEEYSSSGYRVLVVGYSKEALEEDNIHDLEYLGLILIQDNIRKNAKEIIGLFNKNDVNVKVISGDNVLTVKEIAKVVGIVGWDKYISLDGLTDEEVKEAANKYYVFGRVKPEQKEILIEALKGNHHTVAMVGDGINDCLSLKRADVGISIKSASKAAQNVANIVIIDDDFSHLPDIIDQGRRVINNLQRTCSLFLNKTIFSFVLNLFFIIYGFIGIALKTEPMLWPFEVNNFYVWELFGIGLSSFFLALEPNSQRIKGNFLANILKLPLFNGSVMAIIIIWIYLAQRYNDPLILRDISTLFISFASILILFEVCYKFNRYRLIVFIGSIIFTFLFIAFSIYNDGLFNLLLLSGSVPHLLKGDNLVTLLIMIAVFLYAMVVYYIIKEHRSHESTHIKQ